MNKIQICNIVKDYISDTSANVDQHVNDSVNFLSNLFQKKKIDSSQTTISGQSYVAKPDHCKAIRRLVIAGDEIKESKFDNLEEAEDQEVVRWYDDDDKIQLTAAMDTTGDEIKIWYDEEYIIPELKTIGTFGTGDDQFNNLETIFCDGKYLYICDTANHRIVKRLAADLSYISKIGTSGAGDDQFSYPRGITGDGTYLYVADSENNRIVKRLASDLSYVAQIGTVGAGDDQFSGPEGIFCDGDYLFVADSGNHRIVKRTLALVYVSKIGSAGAGDDQFQNPQGIGGDGTNLYIGDTQNHRVVKRLASDLSYVSKIGSQGSGNDNFDWPAQITFSQDYIYIADANNNRIQKRLASDLSFFAAVGSYGNADELIFSAEGAATDGENLFIADTLNHRLVKRTLNFDEIETNVPERLLDLVYVGAAYRYFRKILSIKLMTPATYPDIDIDEIRKVLEDWRGDYEWLIDVLKKNNS